jgi:MtN3 and saliva related transmembrane protein
LPEELRIERIGTDLIGWAAAAILLLTLARQVYTQWRDRTSQGVSRWLFVGQCTASIGFVVYSWLLGSWVFVVTNALILVTAVVGEIIYLRNKRAARGLREI